MYLVGDSLKALFKKCILCVLSFYGLKVTCIRLRIEESLVGSVQETLSSGFLAYMGLKQGTLVKYS